MADEPAEDESRAMRLFHAVFGRGSTYNPGGSARMHTGGWIMVVGSIFGPVWETFTGSDTAELGWRVAPLAFVLGVLIVRASKKPPAPADQEDRSPT